MPPRSTPLPCIAVHSLTGCAGELLVILENLAQVLPHARVVYFPFAQSRNDSGPVDIALVEGSVSQGHDLERLEKIRANSRWLVALGNCAVWGCVQSSACRKAAPSELVEAVYGKGSPIEALAPSPLDRHVRVDVKLSGCPINATQLLAVLASLLADHLPYITQKPVCLECKLRENPCVLIENNLPCLGPITAGGCGALCPTFGAACYGCWGPSEAPQMEAMGTILQEKGFELKEIIGRVTAFGIPEEMSSRIRAMKSRVDND